MSRGEQSGYQSEVGKPCNTTAQCSDPNSSCQTATDNSKKCLCSSGFYVHSGACTAQIALDYVCYDNRVDNQCSDINAECKVSTGGSYKCLCKDVYYKNSGGVCTQKVVLNNMCTSGQPDNQCVDTNAECKIESGSTYKCFCESGFYENTGGVCTAKSMLGTQCINGQPANQCSVINTECIAETIGGSVYKCLCMASYYRDSQTCKPLTDLQVLNLDVPDATTGETYFLVTWTNPTTISFINGYQLILYVSGVVESAMNVDKKTKTNVNVTNITPGRKYTITIRSLETASRPSAQVTHVTFTDGTKPAIPGAITQSVFNGPTTSVSWTINGDVEYFSGTINDTSASPSTFNLTAVNRQPAPLIVSDLRHGERYSFTVRSHSNGFTSDSYIQTIRTTPTTPSPPTNFACAADKIFDRSITLTWKEPVPPNGDILHFIILDKTRGQQIQTSGTVEQQLVDQLQPDIYYTFTMKTVNDAQSGTSGESFGITCRTKTASPDDEPPIGIKAGVVAAVVAVVIVIVIFILVKKRRNRHKPMKEEEPVNFGNPAGLRTSSMERKNHQN